MTRVLVAAPVIAFVGAFIAARVHAYRRGVRVRNGCCAPADPAHDRRMSLQQAKGTNQT